MWRARRARGHGHDPRSSLLDGERRSRLDTSGSSRAEGGGSCKRGPRRSLRRGHANTWVELTARVPCAVNRPPFDVRRRDVAGFRISDVAEANLYLPVHAGIARTSLVARVLGDPDLARRTLLDRLILIDPNMGQILTMRTIARLET
jgi:hypothetical protein